MFRIFVLIHQFNCISKKRQEIQHAECTWAEDYWKDGSSQEGDEEVLANPTKTQEASHKKE